MKKRICMLLIAALLLSLGTAAFAVEPEVLDAPALGFHFVTPASYTKLKGTLGWYGSPLEGYDPGILFLEMSYYAVTEEQTAAYNAYWEAYTDAYFTGGEMPVPDDPSWGSGYESGTVFTIYGIDGGRGEAELKAAMKAYAGQPEDSYAFLEEIGQKGNTRFYLAQSKDLEENRAAYEKNMGALYTEFVSLCESKDVFLAALTLSEPQAMQEAGIGSQVAFEAARLDGTPVSSAALFRDHDVTMINLWATWCGPCVREMPELAKLGDELEGKNCQIIGLCLDAGEPGMAGKAQAILDEAGVRYTNLIAPENIQDILPTASIPTSFFVDSEGRILTAPVIGALVDQYPLRVEEALDLVAASRPAAPPDAEAAVPAEETAPAEEATPAEETAPAEEATPAEEIAPVEEAAPAVEVAPVEEAAPAVALTPVEEAAPAGEAAPVETAAPAPVVEEPTEADSEWIEYPDVGLSMALPRALNDLRGTLSLNGSVLSEEIPIYEMEFDYTAVPMDRFEQLYHAIFEQKQAQPEQIREFVGSNVRIFSVFCVGGNRDFDALAKAYEDYYDIALKEEQVEKLALDKDCSFYLCRHYQADGKSLPAGVYADELRLVLDHVDDIIDSMQFRQPLNG